jgi:hypothetical protein
MGAVARPDLSGDGRPAGPQILAGWGGGRATGPFDDGAAFASYRDQMPDHVLGTDWKRSQTQPVLTAEAPASGVTDVATADVPPDAPLTQAAYDAPPRVPPAYPSLQGGAELPPAQPDAGDAGQG